MNKFLEKIAKKKEGDGYLKRYGKGIVSDFAIATPALLAANEANKSMTSDLGKAGVGRMSTLRKMKKQHGLDFTFSKKKAFTPGSRYASHNWGSGPAYVHHTTFTKNTFGNLKNHIHTEGTRNIGILAHEMGHAVSHKGSGTTKALIQGLSRGGVKTGAGYLIGTGMLMNDKTKDKAWMAPAVIAAPALVEEANANRHAYNAFKKFEGKGVANKFLKKVVSKNTASYALPVLGASLGLAAAGKWIKPHKKEAELNPLKVANTYKIKSKA